jgi:hypothetical protein
MFTTMRLRAFLVTAALATGAACASNPRPGVEYVRVRPPGARVEVIAASPGSDYAWVQGHWAWRRNEYAWEPGHYVRIERGYRQWVSGHWAHDRHGWYYVEGRWIR